MLFGRDLSEAASIDCGYIALIIPIFILGWGVARRINRITGSMPERHILPMKRIEVKENCYDF
jgi:hypothetical protein